jgi:hypothetical protein
MAETFDVLIAGGGAKLLLRSARGLTPIEVGLIFLRGIIVLSNSLLGFDSSSCLELVVEREKRCSSISCSQSIN